MLAQRGERWRVGPRDDALAPFAIGASRDEHRGDAGMARDRRLDLGRPDLLAAAHDDIGEPAENANGSLLVDLAAVSGSQPPARLEGAHRRLRVEARSEERRVGKE